MSDTEYVYREDTGELEIWYRHTCASENPNMLIIRKRTTDGINWTNREVMIDSWFTEKAGSQTIIWEDDKYKMWFTGD